MLVGIEVHAFGLDDMHVVLVEEGNELLPDELYSFAHGIDVVRDVASDFKYLRVLNTNNTVIEVVTSKK